MRNRGVEIFVPPLMQSAVFHEDFTASSTVSSTTPHDSRSIDSGLSTDGDSPSDSGNEEVVTKEEEEVVTNDVSLEGAALDVTALLVVNGLQCPGLQNCLVAVHTAVASAVPGTLLVLSAWYVGAKCLVRWC
jgi:hypothetical protein